MRSSCSSIGFGSIRKKNYILAKEMKPRLRNNLLSLGFVLIFIGLLMAIGGTKLILAVGVTLFVGALIYPKGEK